MQGKAKVAFVLFFDCSEAVMEERLINRGKTSGRADDNPESIKKRFLTYRNDTLPVIEKYRTHQMLAHVDANRNPDEIWVDVQKEFAKFLNI
jgi:adenylate kinase family enzyme